MTFFTNVLAATALAVLPFAATAADTILTVTHNGNTTSIDMSALEAMEVTEFETTTIWTDGPQTFTGVSLATFLEGLGVEEGTMKATAINDYAVEIPVADAVEGGPIIAYRLNGSPMSVREKGPLWIVYPFDSDSSYQSEVIYSRSIWQLDRIEIIE